MFFLLVAYSINLAWELVHWHEVFFGASKRGIALGLLLRFVFLSLGIFLLPAPGKKNPAQLLSSRVIGN